MTLPLTDQRPRDDLITELYDRHAAGLFAYCADQLGDPASACDALVAVLTGVPSVEPPRAAMYALARREIYRRDIVYAPPSIDPLVDPATALVERTVRELRPHQREVLLLSAVCGLDHAELAWVLDVAPDTAEELSLSASRRFQQSLATALATAGPRLSKPLAEVLGALGVAPLRDVLGRLPWRPPPESVRLILLGPAQPRTAAPRTGSLFLRQLWPSPPTWPQPLAETDPATSTGLFPTELLTPPAPGRVAPHEATTAPMPKVRGSALDTLGLSRPKPRSTPVFLSAPVPADYLEEAPPASGDVLDDGVPMRKSDTRVLTDLLVASAKKPERPEQPGSLFTPRRRHPEPVYRLPLPAEVPLPEFPLPPEIAAGPAPEVVRAPEPVAAAVVGKKPGTPLRRRRERHHDWAWELIGFVICIAIAMIVFFSVPTIVTP